MTQQTPIIGVLKSTALAVAIASISHSTQATQAWSYTYNTLGLIESVDGPRTDVVDLTTYTYSEGGDLTAITNALGQVVQLKDIDGNGRPHTLVDANGITTTLNYHPRGWLTAVSILDPSDPSGSGAHSTTTYDYNANGDLISITAPNGTVVYYHYDSAQRLVGISNNGGERIDYVLDNAGNRLSETITDNASTLRYSATQAYDELSRVMDIIGAEGQTTHIDYDVNDNPIVETNPRSHSTQHSVDPLDRLTHSTDPEGGTTAFGYDHQDRLTTVTDANGNTTSYSYDAFDNITQIDSPDTGITTLTYDDAGNAITRTDARGVSATYTYDALNRITGVRYSTEANGLSDEDITYHYDDPATDHYGIGRLTHRSDSSGTTHYRYDHRGNLIEKHVTLTGALDTDITTYSYNTADQLVAYRDPNGHRIAYQYDHLGRVSGITHDDNGQSVTLVSDIHYAPFGPATHLTYGNGIVTTFTYNRDYRLTQLQANGRDATPLQDVQFSYDPSGNIIQKASETLGYDPLDRLSLATGDYGHLDYQYDPVGNRLQLSNTLNPQSATPLRTQTDYGYLLGSNQLADTTTGSTVHPYTLDEVGNTLTDTAKGLGFSYNAQNRPVSVTTPTGTVTYRYNALGQRTEKTLNGATTTYHYNETGQLIAEQSPAGQVSYIYLGGQPIAQLRVADASGAASTDTTTNTATNVATSSTTDTLTLISLASEDGWVSESQPDGSGNYRYHSGHAFWGIMVGDDNNDRQYRSILGFDLTALPAGATITDAQVVLKRRYNSSYGAVTDLGAITLDLAVGHFGAEPALRTDDFFAPATHAHVGDFSDSGTTSPASLNASGLSALNEAHANGNAHIQLRLQQPAHPGGNLSGDRLIYYSANEVDPALQPQLVISYTTEALEPEPQPSVSGVYYYHNDQLGTPQILTDHNQEVSWAASYTPFGKAALTTAVVENNLRFAGQYFDSETKLHYNWHRYYDPSTGRYTTSDPLGLYDGPNTYGYGQQNPLGYADPTGLVSNPNNELSFGDGPHQTTLPASSSSALFRAQNCPRIARPHKVVRALSNFRSINGQFGPNKFKITKKGMKHVLERHHPRYWDGSVKKDQSFFKKNVSVEMITSQIKTIMRQNRDSLIRNGHLPMFQVRGNINGQEYVLGFKRGEVRQFFPAKNQCGCDPLK